MRPAAVALLVTAVLVAGCSSSATSSSASVTETTATSSPSASMGPLGTVISSGFGQRDKYVWVSAIIHNNTQKVGQTVTVNFNVLDAGGAILKSEAQVESFSAPGADHIIGTQVDLGTGQKAASVEVTLLVEDRSTFSSTPFPTMPVTTPTFHKDEYGSSVVTFELSNNQSAPVSSPRIGIACVDSAGKIVGGGVSFPELVPAGGRIKVDADVIVSGDPASCSVFVGAPVDWGSTPAPTATAAESGTAASAFETWVNQFTAQDWAAQYNTLVSAQQALLSKDKYVSCRTANGTMTMKWVGVVSSQEVGADPIPGTSSTLPSTLVKASIQVSGVTMPIDAHMYNEKGVWKWAMTQQNLTGCGVK